MKRACILIGWMLGSLCLLFGAIWTETASAVVSVAITPSSAVVHPGSFQQFSASVSGDATNSVAWSVNGIQGGKTSVGTISTTGLYTSPLAVPQSFTVNVTATSRADPSKSASANVSVLSNVEVVFGGPVLQELSGGDPYSGFPFITNDGCGLGYSVGGTVTGSANTDVIRSVNGIVNGSAEVGTIMPFANSNSTGVYDLCVPRGMVQPTFFTVAIAPVADPLKSAVQLRSYLPNSYPYVSISPPPTAATGNGCEVVTPGKQINLSAYATPSAGPVALFAVNGVPGGSSTVGTIAATPRPDCCSRLFDLVYTAPSAIPTPPRVSVQALNASNGQVLGSRELTIASPPQGNISVSISPTSASLRLEASVQFNAVVSGVADQGVTWSIFDLGNDESFGNAFPTLGTISSTGLLTAPLSTRIGLVNVVARSKVNCAGSAPALVAYALPALNYSGLWWNAPAVSESGWGINLAHQGDVIFLTWFTYDAAGKAWWLTMTANKTAEGVYSGTLYQTTGPAFNAVPFDPSQVGYTQVGNGTLTFNSATAGTFAYTVNGVTQAKTITLQAFGPLPTCVWGAQPNFTNFQGLWWAAPAGAESGWGVNVTQEGTTIFATWFTYDANHNPLWYSVTATPTGPNTFSGTLIRTKGPAFSAVPFDPTQVQRTPVGTTTFSFTNGDSGTFAYQVNDGANVATQAKAIVRQVFRPPETVCQ